MDKKNKKIIIISFIVILLLAILGFFLFLSKSKQSTIIEKTKNLFPFGKIETGIVDNKNKQQTTEKEEQTTTEKIPEKRKAEPRLRLVADFPIGGFIPIVKVKDKNIVDISIDKNGVKSEINKTIQIKNDFIRYSAIKNSTFYEAYVDPYEIKHELISENFIPNTEQVFFSKDGNNVLLQYWDNLENSASTYLAKIKKTEVEVKDCPYSFTEKIEVGDKGKKVLDLHSFLNENPKTKISSSGLNSPGNESPIAIPATITAIKNFQSLNELDIDGKLGQATRKKMLDICNINQQKKAEERFKKLDKKYETSGFFLPMGTTDVAISPNGDNFFYLEKDPLGVIGIIRSFKDNNFKKTIFESPYYGWIVRWNNEENIELTTKATYLSKGFSYHLNPKTSDYHKSFKEKDGLTTLASNDNLNIFVEYIEGNSVINSIFNRKKQSFTDLFIETFPEKCVWSKNNVYLYCAVPNSLYYGEKYPDQWYKGLESFNDSLWRINSDNGETVLISNLGVDFGKDLDISKIDVDEDDNYLYFVDKKTEYLWSYRLLDV